MSTSPAGKGKSVTPTTASAKRKLAQVGSVALKRQEQHVGKEGDAKLTAVSPKSGVVASPRKSVKKMKVKADAPAVKTVVTKTPTEVGPNGESQAKTVKLRAKAEAQLEQKKSVSVSLSSATASLESFIVTVLFQAGTAAMPAPEQQQVLASKEQQGKTCAVPRKTAPEMIATTTPLKATEHAKTQLAATVVSTTAIDKLAVVRPTPSAKGVPDVSPAPARIEPTVPTTSGESFPSQSYGTPSTVASTAAHVEATIATGTVTAITGASSTQATKTCASSPSLKAKVSSPVPLPCGLKRRRSTDLASANIDALPPPAKKQSGVNEAVVTIKPRVSQQTEPREKKIPSYTPNSSSDQVSSSSQEPAIRAAQRERPAHTPAMLNKVSPKSNCPAEQLTPSVELTVPIVTQEVVRPLTATMPSAHTNQAWLNEDTGKLKSIVKRETASRTTAPTKTDRRDCLSAKTSSESTSKSMNVDIVMDSHAYVQKMMSGELEAHRGSHPGQPSELTVALPPRPQNAWGASFGMIPPSNGPSSVSRTSTTPLSSWFLSKGCANFIKQVHFPDDDDNDSSDDDGITTRQPPGATRGIDKASPKRRASFVKKNSFLESLKTQSNWRSWYGHVDMHNLLDPPLAHIPEKLQMHESTPLQLPEAAERRATTKKANDLEMLEADIRYGLIAWFD
ncbi:hypothetical protein ON010_g13897 [Phytophthora cinnamomi]|nr:hypothetical protein ON010_g13897 [Phytophthora cinnamomi]